MSSVIYTQELGQRTASQLRVLHSAPPISLLLTSPIAAAASGRTAKDVK